MTYGDWWRVRFILFTPIPSGGSSGEKEFEPIEVSEKLLFPVGERAGKGQHGRRR